MHDAACTGGGGGTTGWHLKTSETLISELPGVKTPEAGYCLKCALHTLEVILCGQNIKTKRATFENFHF